MDNVIDALPKYEYIGFDSEGLLVLHSEEVEVKINLTTGAVDMQGFAPDDCAKTFWKAVEIFKQHMGKTS